MPNMTKVFGATGTSGWFAAPEGDFNMLIKGGAGTIRIEKTYDNGTTVYNVAKNADGDVADYVISTSSVALVINEPVRGAQYRFECTAYTSPVTCEFRSPGL